MTVGMKRAISKVRIAKGLKQWECAEQAGMSQPSEWSNLERVAGTATISVQRWGIVAEVLSTSGIELLTFAAKLGGPP
jgi:hypothetical protein